MSPRALGQSQGIPRAVFGSPRAFLREFWGSLKDVLGQFCSIPGSAFQGQPLRSLRTALAVWGNPTAFLGESCGTFEGVPREEP